MPPLLLWRLGGSVPRRSPATGSQAAQPAPQLGTAHQLCLIFTLAGASYPGSTQKRKSEQFRTKTVVVAKSGQRLPEAGLELTEPSSPPELVHVAQLPKLAWQFRQTTWVFANSGQRLPEAGPEPTEAEASPAFTALLGSTQLPGLPQLPQAACRAA